MYVLHTDGNPTECPFKTSAPTQDQYGRVVFITQPCTSQCAHFSMREKRDSIGGISRDDSPKTGKHEVALSCGGSLVTTVCEITEPESKIKPIN